MKKYFVMVVAFIMTFAFAAPILAETELTEEDESPVEISIAKVDPGLIAIDGKKDDAYNTTSAIDVTVQSSEAFSETTAKIWVVWDGSFIYTYAECVDPEVLTIHGGDNSNEGLMSYGDILSIIVDWDYNREFISSEHQYSYDEFGDNVSFINIAADGGQDFFQSWHLVQEDMPYHELVSTYAYYDEDVETIYYEARIPVPHTEVEVTDGMKVGYEVAFTNANSVGLNKNPKNPRVGSVSLSPFGSKMWRWTHVCATAILLGAEETDEPTDPIEPTDPVNPVEPTGPVEPSDPVEPDEPSTPDVPELPDMDLTDPADPVEPDVSEDPDEPTEPDVPAEPDEPTEPDVPEDPDEPTESDVSEDPDEPTGPNIPEDPDEPTEPDVPVEPDEPTEPDVPVEPDEPAEPDEPTEPDVPAEPEEPTGPDVPEEPEEPTEPDVPEEPDEPADTDAAEIPSKLGVPAIIVAVVVAVAIIAIVIAVSKKK